MDLNGRMNYGDAHSYKLVIFAKSYLLVYNNDDFLLAIDVWLLTILEKLKFFM